MSHQRPAKTAAMQPPRLPLHCPVHEVYTFSDLESWGTRPTDEQPIRLGVFGSPVAHSRSPEIQNAALEQWALSVRYGRFEIAPDELEPALRLLPTLGFIGVNLTIPHKIAATALMDELHPFARSVGAVNTVRIDGEKLIGFNTDGPGFARAIRSEFAVDLRDLRVLLLGAGGGAGRSIALQCAAERCERLVLVNRSHERAEELAAELKHAFADTRVSGPVARLQAVRWNEQALREQIANSDLIVNATPLGMKHSDLPVLAPSSIEPHLMVYDTIYHPARTPLLAAAAEAGARGANGLSMLLHHGALAFEHWFEREAPVDVMRAALSL